MPLSVPEGLRPLLVVTLDSCRYDTAAGLPVFLGVGERLIRARSHGTFTLPSHTALFFGYPPAPTEAYERCDIGLFGRVPVRRGHTYRTGKSESPQAGNWLDDLRRVGVRTVGAGGVRWFLHDQLRVGFDEFHY